ncbi:hypothetical protein [Aliarcobacter butzleri]|uniref:hypothetical protein n=1 Tax=Aliarcobacter butzleri TaxID=28197 RepID=UPI0012698FC2|nr:hypothetical protein [Aliarcobacter butzleri]
MRTYIVNFIEIQNVCVDGNNIEVVAYSSAEVIARNEVEIFMSFCSKGVNANVDFSNVKTIKYPHYENSELTYLSTSLKAISSVEYSGEMKIDRNKILKIITENKNKILGKSSDFAVGFNHMKIGVYIETLISSNESSVISENEKFNVTIYGTNLDNSINFDICLDEFVGEFIK